MRESLIRQVVGCSSYFFAVPYLPFLSKPCRRQPKALLRLTWQLGKVYPPARRLYEWYGRPSYRPGDWALIEQVNFPNEYLDRLAEVLAPNIIAVLRNPYASISSSLRYYQTSSDPQ